MGPACVTPHPLMEQHMSLEPAACTLTSAAAAIISVPCPMRPSMEQTPGAEYWRSAVKASRAPANARRRRLAECVECDFIPP